MLVFVKNDTQGCLLVLGYQLSLSIYPSLNHSVGIDMNILIFVQNDSQGCFFSIWNFGIHMR